MISFAFSKTYFEVPHTQLRIKISMILSIRYILLIINIFAMTGPLKVIQSQNARGLLIAGFGIASAAATICHLKSNFSYISNN